MEFIGEFLSLLLGATTLLHQGLPFFLVVVPDGGLPHVFDPAREQLVIETAVVDHERDVFLLLAGDFPNAHQVVGGLERKRARQFARQRFFELPKHLLFLVDFSFEFLELVDNLLWRLRVLLVDGVKKYAGQAVVIGLWNRIVLVIMAAGALHSQAEETARDHVDAVVALIGAGHFIGPVVVIPGPEA